MSRMTTPKPARTLRQLATALEREDEWLTTAQITGLLRALGRRWCQMDDFPLGDEFDMVRRAGRSTSPPRARATGRGKGGR